MNTIQNIALSIFIGTIFSFMYLFFINDAENSQALLIFIIITSIHFNTNRILDKLDD